MVVVEDEAIGFGTSAGEMSMIFAIAAEVRVLLCGWGRFTIAGVTQTIFGIISEVEAIVKLCGRRRSYPRRSCPRRALSAVINVKRFSGSWIDLSLPSVGQPIIVVKCHERRMTIPVDVID